MVLGRIFSVLLLIVFQQATAQTLQIKGEVRDSSTGYTLSGVTVAAYFTADSSLMDVQLSNNAGGFVLKGKAVHGGIDIYVSYTGYQTAKLAITVDSTQSLVEMNTIHLVRSYKELDEVVIKMSPPLSMNGDTLEINPSAYRLGKNAVVEDLLKNVSGIVVWGDGTITVNGKKVQHVYVDGRPFISDHAKVATQNLPKTAIEKVQIYQEVSIDPAAPKSDSILSMNIQLKEDRKNGLLGKVALGYGSRDRYDAGLTAIMFTRQSRLALAILGNNINKKISEIGTALENSTFKNTNPNLADAPDFEMNGEHTNRFYGSVFQHSFKPKKRLFLTNEIRVEVNRSEDEGHQNSEWLQQSSVNEENQRVQALQTAHSRLNASNALVTFTKKKSNTDFSVTGSLDDVQYFLDEKEHASQTLNDMAGSESLMSQIKNTHTKSFGLKGRYNYTDAINLGLKSVNLSYDFSYNRSTQNRNVDNQFKSFITGIPDVSFDRQYELKSDLKRGDVLLSYPGLKRLLLGKQKAEGLELILNTQLLIANESSSQIVKDFQLTSESYLSNPNLTYSNMLDTLQYRPGISIRKSFAKELYARMERRFVLGMDVKGNILTLNNSSTIAERNLDRTFVFFEPEISAGYRHENNNRRIGFAYKGNIGNRVPGIDQLHPVTDSINTYYILLGNPHLKAECLTRNAISFNYSGIKTSRKNAFSFSLKTAYEFTRHAMSDSLIIDETGRTFHFPVNVTHRKKWISELTSDYSVRLAKQNIQLRYHGSFNRITIPGFINSVMNVSEYSFFNNNLSATWSVTDFLSAELVQGIYLNQYKLNKESGGSRHNNLFNTALNVNFSYLRGIIFSNSLNHLYNPAQRHSFVLWNTYLTWRFSKNENYEMKFSAFDLLKNYRNMKTEIGYNFNTTSINSSLQQFFMISFAYYPRFF